MRQKGRGWYFYKHPSAFLGRICYESHAFPFHEMGLVRGFRFERRKTRKERYWVWVDCLDAGGIPVSYRIGDDEVGYLDLGVEFLTLEQIVLILNASHRRIAECEGILGSDSEESQNTRAVYDTLIEDLRDILTKNGHSSTWDHDYVLTQHYLCIIA
jgi:hypothetical protein